jgi:hypothetical protein
MKQLLRIFIFLAGLACAISVTQDAVTAHGQEMTARSRASLCQRKRDSLMRLEQEAPKLRQQIAEREKAVRRMNDAINSARGRRLKPQVINGYENAKLGYQRELRKLRQRQEYVGSQINILDQSLESLRCSSANAVVATQSRSGRTQVPPQSGLPPELRGKTILRTEKVEYVECWSPQNVPCSTPNLETFITNYHLEGGGVHGDRREYDRKRKAMADAGNGFKWSCYKSHWRNGRCV